MQLRVGASRLPYALSTRMCDRGSRCGSFMDRENSNVHQGSYAFNLWFPLFQGGLDRPKLSTVKSVGRQGRWIRVRGHLQTLLTLSCRPHWPLLINPSGIQQRVRGVYIGAASVPLRGSSRNAAVPELAHLGSSLAERLVACRLAFACLAHSSQVLRLLIPSSLFSASP
jgi:hypothetical protein